MGRRRRQKAKAKDAGRVGRVFIGPHTFARARQRVPELEGKSDVAIRRYCVQVVQRGIGKQLVLFSTRAAAYQQVAQPLIDANEKLLGYLVLAPDADGVYEIVVRTCLGPLARQIRDANREAPIPRWYLNFQLRRQ